MTSCMVFSSARVRRQREGHYPVPPGTTPILGVEFSGIVEEVGPNVTNVEIGDEVFGLCYGVSDALPGLLFPCTHPIFLGT